MTSAGEYAPSARGRYFQVRWDGMVRAVSDADFNKAMEESEVSETANTDRKLPRYRCHKQVFALKIGAIQPVVGGDVIITAAEHGYLPFRAKHPYAEKHKPEVGGYWVQYDDGYESYSPAKAFEEGYTRI